MNKKMYPTPHINAKPEDFAKTVLMPGDPKRAEFIANTYLEKAKLVNDVRGVKGYTGYYKEERVSVMASGMGVPSMGIYSHELFNFFGVENIIRIGSAGAMQENVRVRDVIFALGACTDSNFSNQYNLPGYFAPVCDYTLLSKAYDIAKEMGVNSHIGNVLTSDVFYKEDTESNKAWQKMNVLAVEMETAALYMTAARARKKALTICTISDSLVTGEALSADERQNSFTQMMEIALNTAISI